MTRPAGDSGRADWIRHAAERLAAAGADEARADAELLWCRASGETRAELALRRDEPAPPAALERFRGWLPRFAAGEPLAYLEGRAGFYGIELEVDARVLVPRADSECVVELALERAPAATARVADLGTGSGCLLLALLSERPRWRGIGVDRSDGALRVARSNAKSLGFAPRVSFVRADWTAGLRGAVDLIVANPPYVVPGEPLGPGVAEYEPHAALFTPPGDPGWAYRAILDGAAAALVAGGALVFEVGAGRADDLAQLARARGWREIGRRRDLGGVERALAFLRA